MTETSMEQPGTHEPLILERLSDLEDQADYLAHYADIRGWAVVNSTGDEVGIVDDLYVNPRDQQVEMAAITFMDAAGYEGKHVLIPVEELQILDHTVRVLPKEEKIRLAPEFHEGAPMYEPYYEYWSSQAAGPAEEPSVEVIRPPGRLALEGEESDEGEEVEIERASH